MLQESSEWKIAGLLFICIAHICMIILAVIKIRRPFHYLFEASETSRTLLVILILSILWAFTCFVLAGLFHH